MAGSALTPKVGGFLAPQNTSQGTKLAIGIVLLWFAGFCFFVAFMSGKVASLTIGTDQNGNPSGPRDMPELMERVSANVQALEGGAAGISGASAPTGTTGGGGVQA